MISSNKTKEFSAFARYRLVSSLLLALLLLVVWITGSNQIANGAPLLASSRLVVDQANFFTAEQAQQLQAEAAALGAQYQMDIVIVTTTDTGGKSSRDYADDYFDFNGYGVGPDRDGILFLLDYDNREAYISTSGSGIKYLTDQRIEQVLDAVFDGGLPTGDNFGATKGFLNQTEVFLQAGIPSDQYGEPEDQPRSLSVVDGILGLLGAGGSSLGFFGTTRSSYKGKPRPNVFEFRSNSLVNMGVTSDNLIDSYVTTRRLPPPPPPPSGGGFSGRSTTHTSSSGRSHGGGGRGF
ncbi:MAG: TPM domain-containing protein [Ruminococcaceae bacterium]|nr:TPM domain-containing protein [Oscillospiraceae bacterium]